jgi:type I restriction enzyme S subunit
VSLASQPFLDVIQDASRGNTKIPQKEYLDSGQYPIVDQGKDIVGGYTDDASTLCKVEPPVIVFGDHTRAVKYVDFPFAMGADGTKILIPKRGDDCKYLYHAIKSIRIEEAGYSRHFKFLKESRIPLPPLEEQKRIAKILDAADALRAKCRESLAQLDELLQSTFFEFFGDPVSNTKGLKKSTLKDVFEFQTGKLDSNAAVPGGKYPFFTCARETSEIDNYAFDCKALLLAGNNANADYSVKYYDGKFNAYQRTYVITLNEGIIKYEYAKCALELMLKDLKRFSKGSNTKYLTLVILNRMPILLPELELQNRFVEVYRAIERQKAMCLAHFNELSELLSSLQSRAFSGEL